MIPGGLNLLTVIIVDDIVEYGIPYHRSLFEEGNDEGKMDLSTIIREERRNQIGK